MNKKTYVMATVCLMALAGCTQKDELPEHPKDKEEYRDSQGNQWIYNAMLMRWALMPSMSNGLTTTHYYYPQTQSWTNSTGVKVEPPSNVNVTSKGSSPSSKGKVFGRTGGSHSIHA